jgi:hypothetical protein
MNWIFLVSGGLILVFSGLVGADYLSTSILTDKSFVLASSGQTANGSYGSRVMIRMHQNLHGPCREGKALFQISR